MHRTIALLRSASLSLTELVLLAIVFGVLAFVLGFDVWWKVWVLAIAGASIYTAGKIVSLGYPSGR